MTSRTTHEPQGKLLGEMTEAGYCLRLALTEDEMACFVCAVPLEEQDAAPHTGSEPEGTAAATDAVAVEQRHSSSQTKPAPAQILHLLQQYGIQRTVDVAAVYEFCAALEMGVIPEPAVVAQGVPPQKGEDGWLELYVKVPGSGIALEEDAQGRVDHKALNRFTVIQPGQKLARVHGAKAGIDGITVRGHTVSAEPGEPYKLQPGQGVVLKYDNRLAVATKAGRAMLEGQTLYVVDEMVVPGDLDLTVGDIHFKGFVEVKGEVPDDFDVHAEKGLYIHGAVGACQIEAGGPVELQSMFGRNIGQIVCQGDLRAQILNQVSVFCYGDVWVNKEIRNCRIRATGKVVVASGMITGGECTALTGIEAGMVGAVSGQKTLLRAGVYFPDQDRFDYLQTRQRRLAEQIAAVHEAITPLQQLAQGEDGLAATAQKRLTLLTDQLEQLQREHVSTEAEINASAVQQAQGRNAKINVHKALME